MSKPWIPCWRCCLAILFNGLTCCLFLVPAERRRQCKHCGGMR